MEIFIAIAFLFVFVSFFVFSIIIAQKHKKAETDYLKNSKIDGIEGLSQLVKQELEGKNDSHEVVCEYCGSKFKGDKCSSCGASVKKIIKG